MLENLEKYKIILCSNSPRRRELLSGLGLNFEVRVIDNIDESYNNNNRCEEIAEEISLKKADAYIKTIGNNELIITADTIVYNNGDVLGKPHTAVPTALATPSPNNVLCKPGSCVKSVPIILDNTLWSL